LGNPSRSQRFCLRRGRHECVVLCVPAVPIAKLLGLRAIRVNSLHGRASLTRAIGVVSRAGRDAPSRRPSPMTPGFAPRRHGTPELRSARIRSTRLVSAFGEVVLAVSVRDSSRNGVSSIRRASAKTDSKYNCIRATSGLGGCCRPFPGFGIVYSQFCRQLHTNRVCPTVDGPCLRSESSLLVREARLVTLRPPELWPFGQLL